MIDIEKERHLFEVWYIDDMLPGEVSSYYANTVIFARDEFAREEDGDWYVHDDVQNKWRGWCGAKGIDLIEAYHDQV